MHSSSAHVPRFPDGGHCILTVMRDQDLRGQSVLGSTRYFLKKGGFPGKVRKQLVILEP